MRKAKIVVKKKNLGRGCGNFKKYKEEEIQKK